MKTATEHETTAMKQRRHLLKVLGGLGILGLAWPGASRPAQRHRMMNLKEADFYRPHDLAG